MNWITVRRSLDHEYSNILEGFFFAVHEAAVQRPHVRRGWVYESAMAQESWQR